MVLLTQSSLSTVNNKKERKLSNKNKDIVFNKLIKSNKNSNITRKDNNIIKK